MLRYQGLEKERVLGGKALVRGGQTPYEAFYGGLSRFTTESMSGPDIAPLGSVIVAAADQLIASTRPSVQTVLYTSQVSTKAEYITIIHAVKQA